MPCYSPLTAFRSRYLNKNGKRELVFDVKKGLVDLPVTIPCGQCIGCKLDKAKEWQTRMTHEAKMHFFNMFLTLTYAPEHLPPDMSLSKRDVQLFNKKLRKHCGSFRFYACGEYGEENRRPHYHAGIFGVGLNAFPDLKPFKKSGDGYQLYTSETLNKIWGKGYVVVSSFSADTAGYIAQYVTKKITGEKADDHYQRFDSTTGEVFQVEPEFALMSNRPGIGSTWYDKYQGDAFPSDFLINKGKKVPVPKYYRRKLEVSNPSLHSELKMTRKIRAKKSPDNTGDRLYTREVCTIARLTRKKRTI